MAFLLDPHDSEILALIAQGGVLAQRAQEATGLSRVTVSRRIALLVANGYVARDGSGTRPSYRLGAKRWWLHSAAMADVLHDEFTLWTRHVAPLLSDAPPNVRSIAQTGFTEMVNNVIDHAQASHICMGLHTDGQRLQMAVMDDGQGAFHNIAQFLDLPDPRLAALELAKGKLTTAAAGHSGIGVFVCSRMFDRFVLRSQGLLFSHGANFQFDWANDASYTQGTVVLMEIALNATRKPMDVYSRYFDPQESGGSAFHTTEVPLRLALLGGQLVSRSQGKWAMARVEQFASVVLDFEGVQEVGQGFVDEVFRVFQNAHPQVQLRVINASSDVRRVIGMFAPSIPHKQSNL